MKAHDVFPAVCYPDLFWRLADEAIDSDWYLMCPHEILAATGYALEDYYGQEWEKRYWDCVKDERIPETGLANQRYHPADFKKRSGDRNTVYLQPGYG